MKAFMDKHAHKINGALCCFDRMLFRGYLLPLRRNSYTRNSPCSGASLGLIVRCRAR